MLVILSSFGYSYDSWMNISDGNRFPGGKRGTTGNVSLELTTEMNPFTVQFIVKANLAL